MKFVARAEELSILERAYNQDSSSFVAVYGRRRIGKTELINHFVRTKLCPLFSVTGAYDATLKSHLNNFANKCLLAFGCQKPTFDDWDEAFIFLQQEIAKVSLKKGCKFTIFIDELPWLAESKKSGFKSALSLFWNDFASKREDILLIVCGSSTSWIINHIVQDRGSLANRITAIIHLQSFTLTETKAFLEAKGHKGLTHKVVLDYFMALGGVAHYLGLLEKKHSFVQNMEMLFFQPHALLRTEYYNLFATLFKNHETHENIIKHLCKRWSGLTLSQLGAKKNLQLGSTLSNALRELEESGFLVKRQRYGQKKRDILYSIGDPFIYFFTKWVEGISMVELTQNQNYFHKVYASSSYRSWAGFAFENISHTHLFQIKKALGIGAVITQSYYWSATDKKQGTQIDILLERADDVINIIECKYYNKEFTIDKAYAKNLQNKVELFYEKSKYRGSIQVVMLTAFGVKQNGYFDEIVTQELTLDALFLD
jgi:hypothetical protein